MIRRIRYKAAMWKDGFTPREKATALQLFDTGNHAGFIRYCADVIRTKATLAVARAEPLRASLDAYL
jgi:hypothetical protein